MGNGFHDSPAQRSDGIDVASGQNEMAMHESHRPSDYIVSSLPEVVQRRDDDKETFGSHGIEVAGADQKELHRTEAGGPNAPQVVDANAPEAVGVNHSVEPDDGVRGTSEKPLKKSRRRRLLGCIAAIVIVVLAIGLGVGLGIGLNANHGSSSKKSTSSSGNQTSSGSQNYSEQGAFNGTGIGWVTTHSTNNLSSAQVDWTNPHAKYIFFQHWTGEIRWIYQGGPDGSIWDGGTIYDVVATNAKNGTPISAYSPGRPGVREFDVFYVDKNNLARQRRIDDITYTWRDGPLNDLDIRVFDADRVGLKACFYLGPIAGVPSNQLQGHGMRLFVATGSDTFEQLSWYSGMSSWVVEQTWPDMNGQASPACFGWGSGHTFYTWFVNVQNTIEMWWVDSKNTTSTSTSPINSWTKSSLIYPAVDPSMGLDFHYLLYAKLATGEVQGFNMTLANGDSILNQYPPLGTIDGSPPTDYSQLAVSSTPVYGGPVNAIVVFYQTTGDDIMMFTGNKTTGEWNVTKVPIT